MSKAIGSSQASTTTSMMRSCICVARQSRRYGELTRIVGLTIEAKGITATVGSICRILKDSAVEGVEQTSKDDYVDAQVVGFESGTLFMMPLWDAFGLQAGAKTYLTFRDR